MEALGINLNFLISQIINFVIILFILWRFVWNPLVKLMDQRKQRIQESLAEAERVRQEAAQEQAAFEKRLADERQKATAQMAEAAKQGQQVREEIVVAAQKESEQIVANAQRQATDMQAQALADARRQIADLAVLAAQKVIGSSMDEGRQRQLVNEFLDKELALRGAAGANGSSGGGGAP